ncbi:MAG: PqqD family peptide modification chaperone [bacterium]|nr:PqqD family peptide modification chaperone [bacterium]
MRSSKLLERPAVTPEAELVTALAAGHGDGVRSALHARPDGGTVSNLAALHQVDALCWWMWEKILAQEGDAGSLELPPRLSERLRMAYLHHLLRNEALVNDLAVLQDALAARGIEALYFKGPWVAFAAYPDPGTRPVGDVDLGIREGEYAGAVEALRAAGWSPDEALPETSSEALRRSHYSRQLRFSAPGRRPLELHLRLINVGLPGPEERWVWETARDLPVGRRSLRVPGPEAMLLHLLLHANQHGFAVLRLLHDVRWALAYDRRVLDAAAFLRLVERLRCRAACYHALELATDLAGAVVEDSILDALRPSAARRMLFAFLWRLGAVRRLAAAPRPMAMEAPLLYLLEMGGGRDKARFTFRVLVAAARPRRARRRIGKAPPERAVAVEKEMRRYPRLRDGVIFRQVGKDSVIYNPMTDHTALLNVSAAAVLDLCDGSRTAGEIANELAALFAGEERDVLAGVEATVNDLTAQGFLDPARGQGPPPHSGG